MHIPHAPLPHPPHPLAPPLYPPPAQREIGHGASGRVFKALFCPNLTIICVKVRMILTFPSRLRALR